MPLDYIAILTCRDVIVLTVENDGLDAQYFFWMSFEFANHLALFNVEDLVCVCFQYQTIVIDTRVMFYLDGAR